MLKTLFPETLETAHALSREDLKELRRAHEISFYRTPTRSYIKAKLKSAQGDEYNKEHEVQTQGTLGWISEEPDGHTLPEVAVCSHWMCHIDEDMPWYTIARLLKVGDKLQAHWYRDAARNGYMKDAGLHGDRLYLIVHRKGKRLVFDIETQCCGDNTARMIRRGPWNNE